MDLKDIKAIIDLMKKNSISEFELERQEFKIKLKRGGNAVVYPDEPQIQAYAPGPMMPIASATVASALPAASSTDQEIKSPMIGTFYRAPSPEAAPSQYLVTRKK